MRIAVVNATWELGGAGLVAIDVARAMAARGHEVRLFVSARSPAPTSFDGVTVEALETGDFGAASQIVNPLGVAALMRALQRFGPDVVNLHGVNLRTFSVLSVPFVSRAWPTTWTLHDLWPVCMTGWPEPPDCDGMFRGCAQCPTWPDWQTRTNRVVREAAFRAAPIHIIAPSDWMRQRMTSSVLGDRATTVIANGVDTALFNPDVVPAELPKAFGEGRTVLLFVGGKALEGRSPAERKGWAYLREALVEVAASTPVPPALLYVGDPIQIDASFPVPVHFTGSIPRPSMPAFYRAADIFVLPTLGDNAPLSILESMACGTPVIASRTGGVPEVIQNGENGVLVAPRSSRELAAAILEQVGSPDARQRFGARARKDVEARYSIDGMMDRYEQVFRDVGEPKAPAAASDGSKERRRV